MLLLILLFNISGHFLAFRASQYSIKKETKRKIKNRIPEKELTVITFRLSEIISINWEEKGKEFWQNGNLYDVVRTVKSDSSIHFFCINDTQEKTLFANLEDAINRQMNSEAQGNNSSLKKFQTDYFFIPSDLQFPSFEFSRATAEVQNKLQEGFFSESPHPPDQA